MTFLRSVLCCLLLGALWCVEPPPLPPTVGSDPTANEVKARTSRPAVTSSSPSSVDTARAETAGVAATEVDGTPFGAWLFSARFANETFSGFNPDYRVAIGDRVDVRLWGGFDFQGTLPVDEQGNVFLPKVGPIAVGGIRNQELNGAVSTAVKAVFERNVHVYASLGGAQPVKIYVSGYVARPGLYPGNAADSVIAFLDRAGGILPRQGTYTAVSLLRDAKPLATIDLYRFITDGAMPPVQLHDGDVILVPARGAVATVRGLAQNPYVFELRSPASPLDELLRLARPLPEATHARVTRSSALREVDYLPLAGVAQQTIGAGDVIELLSDRRDGMISVRVEGEHDSAREYVVPFGSPLRVVLDQLRYNDRSDRASISLQRISVRQRQKERLAMQLKSLEAAVLNARSNTAEEATLRTREADLALQWIERARSVEPKGQVVIAGNPAAGDMALESGDILVVPRKDPLVLIQGEVRFPTTVLWRENALVGDYIAQAGGMGPNADAQQVVILHRDGSFEQAGSTVSTADRGRDYGPKALAARQIRTSPIRPGDEILVLPMVEVKTLQITKDLTQVLYQIAISAAVVLAL